MITEVKNLNAIITGASTGIGYAIAERFASLGINIAVCARNEEVRRAVLGNDRRTYADGDDRR